MFSTTRRKAAGNLAGLACMILWSTNFPLVAKLLETWHPLFIAPARMAIAGTTVALFAIAIGQGRYLTSIPMRDLVQIGGLALSAAIICFVWAQVFADPVTAAVVISAMPLTSALMGVAQGSERIGWNIALGLACAIFGGVMISLASEGTGATHDILDSFIGAILLILGSTLYIWHSRALVIRFAHVPDVAKSASIMLMAALSTSCVAIIAVSLGLAPIRYDLGSENLLALMALGVFAVGGSSVLWLVTGRLVGVTVASMHHNMVPFYVIILSAFAGAKISIMHVAGAGLVILGAVIAQYGRPVAPPVEQKV